MAEADTQRVRPQLTFRPVEAPTGVRTAFRTGVLKVRYWTWRRAMNTRVHHNYAMRRISKAGLGWRSTGNCVDKNRPTCTSLHTVRLGTLLKTIELKRMSGCRLIVTGGTETGHAVGVHSHGNGWKIDLAPNRCLDRYITRKLTPHGKRGDGSQLYISPEEDLFARESDHWDILFR
ncbi:hypothetical protein [Herbidospora sp. RD11066]